MNYLKTNEKIKNMYKSAAFMKIITIQDLESKEDNKIKMSDQSIYIVYKTYINLCGGNIYEKF